MLNYHSEQLKRYCCLVRWTQTTVRHVGYALMTARCSETGQQPTNTLSMRMSRLVRVFRRLDQ